MSDNAPKGQHPSTLTDEETAALRASDPAAFEDGDSQEAPAPGDKGADNPAEPATEAESKSDEGAPDPETGTAPPDMIPRSRLNQVRDREKTKDQLIEQQGQELRQLREAIEANKAPKDFAAERKTIIQKYDDGDLDDDERDEALQVLADERMDHVARSAALSALQQTREATIKRGWDATVAEWSNAHAEFLADKTNAEVLQRSINSVIALHGDSIGNDELLAKAAEQAFAFVGYTPHGEAAATTSEAAANRRAQNARAASDASSAPPSISGGVGERGGPSRDVDVSNIKPGTFSKKLTPDQQEKLLGAGAL